MILVTGSSGYVGTRLYELLSEKFSLLGIDRKKGIYDNFINCDLNSNDLNKKISHFLNSTNNKVSTVIHLAAARTDRATNRNVYYEDNINATKNLLDCSNISTIKKFINVSSVAAIDGKNIEINKKNLSDDDMYRYTKFKQEQKVRRWCNDNDISLVNFLPSAIFSTKQPHNTNTFKLAKFAKYSPIIFTTDTKKSLTELDNLIKNISNHIESNQEGNVLAIEKPSLSIDQIMNIILRKRKTPYFKFKLNEKSLLKIARFWEFPFKYTRIDPIISENRVIKFFSNTEYSDIKFNLKYKSVDNIELSINKNML